MPPAPESSPVLPSGHRLAHFPSIDSTNAEALRRAAHGDRGPLWIRADRQTAGRGRRGRTWASPPGNLYATLLLSTGSEGSSLTEISILSGLAMFDSLAGLLPPGDRRLALKWPNDLMLGGAKIGGLLIECEGTIRPQVLTIGFGINLVHHPRNVSYPASDLSRHGVAVRPGEVLERLAASFVRWLAIRDDGGFDGLRRAWLSKLSGIGETITVNLADGSLTGKFIGVDDKGGLTLRQADGSVRVIMAGDIFLPFPAQQSCAGAE